MNQYCYKIITDTTINTEQIKKFLDALYHKKKLKDLAFEKDEKSPFIIILNHKNGQICIKMTSRAKKNVERIESIHAMLKPSDLKISDNVRLEAPELFQPEQCAWWDTDCKLGQKRKWETLEHVGPYFSHIMEPYEPHKVPIIYDGKEYVLTPKEEKVANFYAQRLLSEESATITQKLTQDDIFNKNYWQDFQKYLTLEHKKIFKNFAKFNFSPIVKYFRDKKESEKTKDDTVKHIKKVHAAEKKQNYGYATINGTIEPVGNFVPEPAGLFLGRGSNPNRGKIKGDIFPEDVTINIGENVKVPEPPKGHKWKKIVHDHDAAWLASWKHPITGENKYIYFGAEGQLKGKSDLIKYEKARKLNYFLNLVRDRYTADLNSSNKVNQQLGTVLYLIDNFGLRVGNEKDESEADTVGASTLRVEHVKTKEPNIIIFDFLGKDSIRYYKEIPVDKQVWLNIEAFLSNKSGSDPLFNLISAADINNYLKTFDKDFSAKVFRTRLASTVMDSALKKTKVNKKDTQDDKKAKFLKANIEVAKILNHRRSAPLKSGDAIKKYKEELKKFKQELKERKEAGKATKAIEEKIKKKKNQIEAKTSTVDIAATTSLTNYIDPRLVVSWTKSNELNIPKVYSATLQKKFKWAIDTTDADWDYEKTPLIADMAQLNPIDPDTIKKGKTIEKSKDKKPIDKSDDIHLYNYSERAVIVIGDTREYKEELKKLGGSFNRNLNVSGEKMNGWVFSKKKRSELEALLGIKLENIVEKILKKPVDRDDKKVPDKPVVKPVEKILKKPVDRDDKKVPDKPVVKPVEKILKKPVDRDDKKKSDDESQQTFIQMFSKYLTPKEENIIKCFGKDEHIVEYIKSEIINNPMVYGRSFLAKFISCIKSFDKDPDIQSQTLTYYQKMNPKELRENVIPLLTVNSIPTYMFLVYFLYKTDKKSTQSYLENLVSNLKDKTDIEKCLSLKQEIIQNNWYDNYGPIGNTIEPYNGDLSYIASFYDGMASQCPAVTRGPLKVIKMSKGTLLYRLAKQNTDLDSILKKTGVWLFPIIPSEKTMKHYQSEYGYTTLLELKTNRDAYLIDMSDVDTVLRLFCDPRTTFELREYIAYAFTVTNGKINRYSQHDMDKYFSIHLCKLDIDGFIYQSKGSMHHDEINLCHPDLLKK